MAIDSNSPAFPMGERGHSGLSKREYFAAMAMQGFIASSEKINNEILARWSVEIADVLLEKLEKKNG
jgi:hypothetical protein